jgi:hypothetical protein
VKFCDDFVASVVAHGAIDCKAVDFMEIQDLRPVNRSEAICSLMESAYVLENGCHGWKFTVYQYPSVLCERTT